MNILGKIPVPFKSKEKLPLRKMELGFYQLSGDFCRRNDMIVFKTVLLSVPLFNLF